MSYRVLRWKFRAHRTKVLGEVYAMLHTIRVRQTPFETYDVFVDDRLEHLSIKKFWLSLVLADNGIDDYKYRNLMRRVNEFGEASETPDAKPHFSLREILFR